MKVNYQALLSNRDVNPKLIKWQGKTAKIWGYTVTHHVLEIRVLSEHVSQNFLRILCGEVEHVEGPVVWIKCNFEVEKETDHIILRDAEAGFVVRAGVIGVEEMAE